jgi:hypothetical protein
MEARLESCYPQLLFHRHMNQRLLSNKIPVCICLSLLYILTGNPSDLTDIQKTYKGDNRPGVQDINSQLGLNAYSIKLILSYLHHSSFISGSFDILSIR